MKVLAPNTLIQNRYLVVHLIGKGGMGEVYLAVDQRLGSAIAVKRTSYADDEMLANAFEREAKILARLRHPVLPKVSDHFTDNGDQFLVMEHISGDDLSSRLKSANKPFPLSWVMFWADQLLDALTYLHSHEPPIIHRDIKPQNLKLADENRIVLLDFGLSKDTANQSVISGSGSGSIVGYTPHFAAMEQIRGTGTNARSDIYSLSATLYQMLSNTVPSDALTRADAMLSGQPDTLKPLDAIVTDISKAVSDVILKGMEVSQDKRFDTAAEMQRALRTAYSQIEPNLPVDATGFNVGDDVHCTEAPLDSNAVASPSEMITKTTPGLAAPVLRGSEMSDASPMDATIQMDLPSKSTTGESVRPAVSPAANLETDPTRIQTFPPKAQAAAVGASASAPKKKSRTGLILAVLAFIGMLVLAGAGAGGYYYLNRDQFGAAVTPSPTPELQPTPEATVEPSSESNTDVNTETDPVNEVEPGSDPTNVSPRNSTKTPPPRGTSTKTTGPPATKTTPKQKVKDDRTVILQ